MVDIVLGYWWEWGWGAGIGRMDLKLEVQSDLSYRAMSGPALIRISNLSGSWEFCLNTVSSVGFYTCHNVFANCY